jgi:F-type H+-transporting ATPase subunit b
MAILYDTYFVVFLSFVLFALLLYRYNVHTMLLSQLDARADRIRQELEDATRLREEAQELLAGFERRQGEVERDAEEIVAQAKVDAEAAAKQAKVDLEESIERRLRAAVDQIAAAESAAMREVKDRAVAVAVAAAADVLRQKMTQDDAAARVDDSIREVAARLH